MDSDQDETLTSKDAAGVAHVLAQLPHMALTMIWSDDEPWRVGESFVLDRDRPWIIGREMLRSKQGFAQNAPGREGRGAPLEGDTISRQQLEIDFASGSQIELRNAGKAIVRVNDLDLPRGSKRTIVRGDVIAVGNHYLFLVGERPSQLPLRFHYPTTHVFGAPDALGIVGESAAAWALRDRLAAAADSRAHVLVLGETGAGKELASHAVHALSDRASGPFVARNAATLPEGVFEAELFGCAKNFPNAGTPERKGLVGEANGGTLMLDEIGTITQSAQAKLLTFLDAGSYYRVGETQARKADVIVIGATNTKVSDLKNDLGPRFGLKVEVPPLRDRVEDIPLIVRHLVLRMAEKSSDAARFVQDIKGGRYDRVSMHFMRELVRESYPGNTRELGEMLRDAMLDSPAKSDTIDPPLDAVNVEDDAPLSNESQLLRTLKQVHWNQSEAAKLLGVSRFKLARLMEKEELRKP